MKSPVKSFSAIPRIFLFSTIVRKPETITIKLIVDTDNFGESNLPKKCSFKAKWKESGREQRSTGDLKEFMIKATVGDTIIWEASSSKKIVHIKQIWRDSGPEIFNRRRHSGIIEPGSSRETVETKALQHTDGREDYKYTIKFKIEGIRQWYKIDPKMRVSPQAVIIKK